MNWKHVGMMLAALLVAVTAFGQVELSPESGLETLGEARTLDAEAEAIIKQAPDSEAKLAAIRALVPTTEAQTNWLAEAESRVLTRLGDEAQAVEAAKRISDVEEAAMAELWVRFNASNYSKTIEVGAPLLARPRAGLGDLHRLRAADSVTRAMKADLGDDAVTRSNRVRVVTTALTNIAHTTLLNSAYREDEPIAPVVVRLVNFVRREGAADAEQVAMLRHLIRVTPVTHKTAKTVGDWKGWLARHGQTNVVLNEVLEGTNALELVDIYAAHTQFNILRPYANSVYGEAYRRGDVARMRRYLDLFPK